MAPRKSLTLPSTLALPNSYRIPSTNPFTQKAITRLSRTSLLTLAQAWLQTNSDPSCTPYLAGDESDDDDLYPAAQSLEELRELYSELKKGKGSKKEVADRILEGDWRHGISLRQLAMSDVQYLLDHPTSQRWTALKLTRTASGSVNDDNLAKTSSDTDSTRLPRFHAPTFLRNLQIEIGSLARGHYYLTRMESLPITLLRIQLHDSPYSSRGSLPTSAIASSSNVSPVIYVAFPDDTSYVYISLLASPGLLKNDDSKSLRKVLIDALPKAFSRPQQRYTLKATSLSTRSLSALVAVRGPSRDNASAGRWSIFAKGSVEESPLASSTADSDLWQDQLEDKENVPTFNTHSISKRPRENSFEETALPKPEDEIVQKVRRLLAVSRFGECGVETDSKGIEKLDVRIEDTFSIDQATDATEDEMNGSAPATLPKAPSVRRGRRSTLSFTVDSDDDIQEADNETSSGRWAPTIQLAFNGSHVFAGIRKLVECGSVDGEKMPGWMTGENGVSVGVIRDGKIRRPKGLGM